ncbi:MAG TPA: cytochrome c biogenesis protein CcsA [Longimicrobiales bacterium]
MVAIFHGLALILYAVAAGVLVRTLAGGRPRVPRGGAGALAAAVVVHGGALAAYALDFGELPLVGLAPSLSAFAFLIGLFLLAMAVFREARTLGVVLLPFVAVMLTAALGMGIRPAGEPLAFRGPWLYLHVVLAFIGYAGLAVASAAGLVYLFQFHELKVKRFGRAFRFFPSLDTLDVVGRRAVALGFPALTLALALGWAWTVRFQNSLAIGNPEVIWGVLTWLTFLAVMGARVGGAARGRRGALASVVGFAVVVLAYVVLRLTTAEGPSFL